MRRRKLSKTPDFRVTGETGETFLVEVKTLRSPSPGHGSIAFKLARAKAQFDGVNDGGRLANVLALVAEAPGALATPLADLALAPDGFADGIDLVLGFARATEEALLLHVAQGSRHQETLRPLITSLEKEVA